ncbi:MAG: class I SAM-dependent methyltransferase [Actinomycetota bacterium]
MGCCTATGCDEFFSDRVARRDAARYRRRGLDGTARRIVALARHTGVAGRTILEVGGGVGAIQIELLRAGAAHAEIVEISQAYAPHAARLLDEAGLAGRVERRHLDFAASPDEVPPADIVIMHRVVCCYPDIGALATAAAGHARRMLIVTSPRDAWWTRLGVAVVNLVQRLSRRTFRVHLHPPSTLAALARGQGLEPAHMHRGRLWELRAFTRAPEASDT